MDAGGGGAVGLTGRWLKEDPKDFASHMYLADQAMAKKDYKAAVPHLRILVEAQPNNTVLLNNLAWAGSANGEVDALQYAERAQRLAPGNPMIMDTLGWLLVERGEVKRGSEILQQAVALAPSSQEIRLHFARALLKIGRKQDARRELEAVANSSTSTPFREEATVLLKSL
jgi:predicted Zn-dependent protease